MSIAPPDQAIVLAAGLGKRMRPLTDTRPKPLVEVAGRSLLDRGLDMLAEAGVKRCAVNVHYLPDQIIDHLDDRRDMAFYVSDERDRLLDSAGGIVKALTLIDDKPFYLLNSDTFWIDQGEAALSLLAERFDPDEMDMALLLAAKDDATGHSGGLDFAMTPEGRLVRARAAEAADLPAYIYAGAAIVSPHIFASAKAEPHSLNVYFDRAIENGRLFGAVLQGRWITVGTPDAIAPAEAAIAAANDKALRRATG
ncbi:nucleotidyltransferase family protein [Notoacmeibacter sp. MSK16QG-6]|uniref:nucleotidyltransferase family protein n=1 Tax=Notoacmeibacter sp. MSK16QG-6 TaxID=2957982 RepID=UPI0020A0D1E8|nr:nucleotidyltransferase family protein [Notoacmeibacter sp. MSK16QG-6]MCP1199012.1 nucleotidyltransferase family protein [Notoacmeibacter sp. MSK16QG-6]